MRKTRAERLAEDPADFDRPQPRKKLEKSVEKKLRLYAKAQGCLVYKFVSPGTAGVPDRIFVAPNGHVGFLELKRPGKKPTDLQLLKLKELCANRAHASWTDSFEGGKKFIDTLCGYGAL